MPAYIHSIATEVPETVFPQDYAMDFMLRHVAHSPSAQEMVQRIYTHSGIAKRHSVIREFAPEAASGLFYDADRKQLLNPPTGARNQRYHQEATLLLRRVGERLMKTAPFEPSEITHVITASCTGFFAPGPDFLIVRELGLAPQTECYHLGFMGCYAAFPALRLANTIVAADPHAVVLIVCLELCSLHIPYREDANSLLGASLFADGAGAALISGRPPRPDQSAFRIECLNTTRTRRGESAMAWTIGNHGFDMILSPRVPALIRAELGELLAPYHALGYALETFPIWAVHPGGRAILDAVELNYQLPASALAAARETLRVYGNMSSATIWFVLQQIVQQGGADPAPLIAMAFGPGLTVETGILEWLPARTKKEDHATVAA
jgi:predicted naringenin-chalcone synthase